MAMRRAIALGGLPETRAVERDVDRALPASKKIQRFRAASRLYHGQAVGMTLDGRIAAWTGWSTIGIVGYVQQSAQIGEEVEVWMV